MYLSDEMQRKLRSLGIIKNNEVLLKEGDLFIILNVETNLRHVASDTDRILNAVNLTENSKRSRLLKG